MTTQSQLPRFRYARLFVASSMLLMGICGICYEYVLGLLGNNLMGSSHEQIFVVIGIMMFAMGMGAIAQKHIMSSLIDWFLWVEIILGLFGGLSAGLIYLTFIYSSSYQLVLYACAFIIGLLIGMEIPLLIRINTTYARSLQANLSDVLSMDYVGSLIGALLFTYVLVTNFSVVRVGTIMGWGNILFAFVGTLYFGPLVLRRWRLIVVSVVASIILLWSFMHADSWLISLQQRCFDDPIIHSETTKYQHIVLTKRKERMRLYINGHIQFDSRDEAIYHEQLVHVPFALTNKHERVLILGGGDGLALREVLKYDHVKEVHLVDIDPGIIRLSAQHPELVKLNNAAFADARVWWQDASHAVHLQAEKIGIYRKTKLAAELIDMTDYKLADVQVYALDADNFVRDGRQQYDLILLDFPDPRSLELAKLYSKDFYASLHRLLKPHGMLAVQSTSPYRAAKVFACVGKTLQAAGFNVLPYHDFLTSFGDWGWHLAWKGEMAPQELKNSLQMRINLHVSTRYLTKERILAAFSFGKHVAPVYEKVMINNKLRPIITQYYHNSFQG